MGNIFSIDSKLMQFLSRIVDMVLLNIVFLLTCIPVFTIGASLTALYTCTLKMVNQEDGHLFRTYFSAWKANFKQAAIVWMIELFVFFVLGMDARLVSVLDGNPKMLLMVITMILQVIAGISLIFVFPILAQFETVSIKNLLLNSICIPLSVIPSALAVIAVTIIPFLIALTSVRLFLFWVYLFVMGWFSLTAYGNSFFLVKIFRPFMPEEEPLHSEEAEPSDEA